MEQNEVEAMFKHLGLTRYEARALITLFGFGKCTAERVSSLADIPLPRVYDTMESLAKKGLISVSKTRPEVFGAIDPKRMFDIFVEEEKKLVDEKISELKDIMPQILKQLKEFEQKPEEESEEVLALVKKRVNIRKDREYFHSIAKDEVLVFAGDLSWIRHGEDAVRSALKRKIKYNVIFCKKTKMALDNSKIFKRLGAKVKFLPDTGDLRCVIIDKKWVSIVLKKFKAPEEPEYSVININHPIIGDVFARYFYSLWDRATKV